MGIFGKNQGLRFIKMNGLGNDFVIIDRRKEFFNTDEEFIRKIADRHTGVGFDQLIVLKIPDNPEADIFMEIYNADGTVAGACGNATRCVAYILMNEKRKNRAVIETASDMLYAERWQGDGTNIRVDMGKPGLDWEDVPLSAETDTLHIPLEHDGISDAVGVSMGNPHAVFFVDDIDNVDVAETGSFFETHEMFPQKANIEFVQILDKNRVRMRVWERGTGITKACGTGACASAVAAIRRELAGNEIEVILDGGSLTIQWHEGGNVFMTGPVSTNFTGVLDESFLYE